MKDNKSIFSRLGLISTIVFFVFAAFAAPTDLKPNKTAAEYCKTLGITEEQVETFRKEMLIGYGEPDLWTEEPKYVVATRTKLKAGKVTKVQYTGFETKKGCEYAWGRDGKAETDWFESDGTPMELKKPEGDGWELMVR